MEGCHYVSNYIYQEYQSTHYIIKELEVVEEEELRSLREAGVHRVYVRKTSFAML